MPRYADEFDAPPPRRAKQPASALPMIVAAVCAAASLVFIVFMVLLVRTNGFAPRNPNFGPVAAGGPVPVQVPMRVPGNVPALPDVPLPNLPNLPNLDVPKVTVAPPLPAGWAYNEPIFGFRAAWPVPPGPDGWAVRETTFGNISHLSNTYAHAGSNGVVYTVSYTDFPLIPTDHGTFIDAALRRIYDNAANRAAGRGQQVPPFQPWQPLNWFGRNARRYVGPSDRGTAERRAVIFGTKMYFVDAIYPAGTPDTDPRLTTFFETFSGL